jgi:hypothetical protein
MKTLTCLAFFLIINFNLFSQSHHPKMVHENLTCVFPGGYSECMIFFKDGLQVDNDGFISAGKLGKDYIMGRSLVVLELGNINSDRQYGGCGFTVLKGTMVEFFPVNTSNPYHDYNDNSDSFQRLYFGLKSCILGSDAYVTIFGSSGQIILPKGSKVNFEYHTFLIDNETFIQARTANATMGRDCILPSLGAIKKGTTVYFNFIDRGAYSNPDEGSITLSPTTTSN